MKQSHFSQVDGVDSGPDPGIVVAIPVRNEAERISKCLDALARQENCASGTFGIVLFLNNCTDETAAVIASVAMPWPMRVIERHDPAASAGWARRKAMNAAADWLMEGGHADGVLLTTDADSRVAPNWITQNLSAIAAGADLVAGRISLDPHDAALLPDRLHQRGRLEAAYETLLIEIDARLDPNANNPWPCHWSKSGATLAVRQSIYRAVGGIPALPTGEDRAFVDAVRASDFVVRHACDIDVVTSGRLEGRASGGVADTIKMRCDQPDSVCDDRLEPVGALINRVLWRRRLRRLHNLRQLSSTWLWAPALAIGEPTARVIAELANFGSAHAAIEAASSRLSYRPVRPSQLQRQIRRAARLVWALRLGDRMRRGASKLYRQTPTVPIATSICLHD